MIRLKKMTIVYNKSWQNISVRLTKNNSKKIMLSLSKQHKAPLSPIISRKEYH